MAEKKKEETDAEKLKRLSAKSLSAMDDFKAMMNKSPAQRKLDAAKKAGRTVSAQEKAAILAGKNYSIQTRNGVGTITTSEPGSSVRKALGMKPKKPKKKTGPLGMAAFDTSQAAGKLGSSKAGLNAAADSITNYIKKGKK